MINVAAKWNWAIIVLSIVIVGCGNNTKAVMGSIDEKDESGEYRERVRSGVLARFNSAANVVTNRSDMIGTWRWQPLARPDANVRVPAVTYQFLEDGTCITTLPNRPSERSRWSLEIDGTFSIYVVMAPAPEHTVNAGQERMRFYLRALSDGRRVLWNGDGSLVKILERAD